ncbi:MAG TPA: nucleotide exchange factor GrpE [Gemmataceae bacterium]|nr:nucleotide exchange factor GrpE [Gemmataceae bacterium]
MTPAPDPSGSALQRLCAEVVALRERNDRQHKLFDQAIAQVRDDLQSRFGQFAADVQSAYQRLRDELTGEKGRALTALNALVDAALDLDKLIAARPGTGDMTAWADGVAGAARQTRAVLAQFGIHPYDAVVGSAYAPALHERVGGLQIEGMEPLRVARQIEPGYASSQPDFVLRRAKVLISE